jgi:sortase (surface protein transpeptidase)
MKRPRPAIVVLMISIAVLITVPIVVAGTSGSSATDVAAVGERPRLAATEPPRYVPGEPEFEFQRVVSAQTPPSYAPVKIRIPSLNLTTAVVPSGVSADGQAEVPEDVMAVGWYRFGRAPSEAQGSTVLVAHRDGRVGGAGAFYNLGSLNVGDKVSIVDEDGVEWPYEVQSREAIDRSVLPTNELFTREGDPMLVLISCGGVYDRSKGGYLDNIVVTARPIADGA